MTFPWRPPTMWEDLVKLFLIGKDPAQGNHAEGTTAPPEVADAATPESISTAITAPASQKPIAANCCPWCGDSTLWRVVGGAGHRRSACGHLTVTTVDHIALGLNLDPRLALRIQVRKENIWTSLKKSRAKKATSDFAMRFRKSVEQIHRSLIACTQK
jgi:hypothetical protein